MLKIALVSHSPHLAGAERMLLNLALALEGSRRYRAHVVVPRLPESEGIGELASALLEHKLNFSFWNAGGLFYWQLRAPCPDVDYSQALLSSVSHLREIIKENGCCAVLGNTLTNLAPAFAAVYSQIPLITWVHSIGDYSVIPELYFRYAKPIDNMVINLSSAVLFVNSSSRQLYALFLRAGAAQIILTNWTNFDVEKTGATARGDVYSSNTFVCLNTLEEHKNINLLIEAAYILKSKGLDFHIKVYGDGSFGFKSKLFQEVNDLGLSPQITFCGRTTDVAPVYEQCLACLQPSRTESFGMTLIEAMAFKKPCIATRTEGPSAIIEPDKTGFLVPNDDARAFAAAMERLLMDKQLAMTMGEAGYARYKEFFSQEKALQRVESAFNAALDGYKGYPEDLLMPFRFLQVLIATSARRVEQPCLTQTTVVQTTIVGRVKNMVKARLTPGGLPWKIAAGFYKSARFCWRLLKKC